MPKVLLNGISVDCEDVVQAALFAQAMSEKAGMEMTIVFPAREENTSSSSREELAKEREGEK